MRRHLGVLAAFVLVAGLGACDWGQPRYGPERHGNNPGETAITTANVDDLGQLWQATVSPAAQALEPLVAGGRAYVVANGEGGGSSTVTAVDADSGARLWSRTYEGPGDPEYFSPGLSMTTVGDTVLVGRVFGIDFGGFEALDAATGAVLWQSPLGIGIIEPVVRDGVVYAGYLELGGAGGSGFTTGAIALEAGTGAPIWRSVSPTLQRPNVAVRGNRAYVGLGNELQVFDAAGVEGCDGGAPATCTPLWTGSLGNDQAALIPAVTERSVFVATENALRVFPSAGCGAATCVPTWSADPAGRIWSDPGLSRDKVLLSTEDGLLAYTATGCGAATCAPSWTGSGAAYGAPSSGNGVVFVGTADRRVRAYAAAGCGAATCAPLWTSPDMGGPVSGSPAVADGRVVAGSSGTLRSFALPA
jgi:outer membrane protein assembly factor BamB